MLRFEGRKIDLVVDMTEQDFLLLDADLKLEAERSEREKFKLKVTRLAHD